MNSGTAITAAMAVSLMVTECSEPNAGSMRTMACGNTILRTICAPDMPSARPARICPGRDRLDAGAHDFGHVGGDVQRQREQRGPERREVEAR